MQVYHAWKMKNMKKNKDAGNDRAPPAIHSAAEERGAAPRPPAAVKKPVKGQERPSRYFRIPFVRPGDDKGGDKVAKKKGWWFAHFDGQWIARQMELHPVLALFCLSIAVFDWCFVRLFLVCFIFMLCILSFY